MWRRIQTWWWARKLLPITIPAGDIQWFDFQRQIMDDIVKSFNLSHRYRNLPSVRQDFPNDLD